MTMCVQSVAPMRDPGTVPETQAVETMIRQMKLPENGAVTLDEWACYTRVPKHRLIKAFHALTGIPPMMFHNALRLEIAKRLLVFDGLSVTDTCFEIGFESLGSFISKFTTQVGIPPGQYARVMGEAGFVEMFLAALSNTFKSSPAAQETTKLVFDRPILSGSPGIVAAVFKKPIPNSYPKTWRFVHALARSTTIPADGTGHCLAATLPRRPKRSELINLKPALIGRAKLTHGTREVAVQMVPPTVFDPPITLAVPALFCTEAVTGQ